MTALLNWLLNLLRPCARCGSRWHAADLHCPAHPWHVGLMDCPHCQDDIDREHLATLAREEDARLDKLADKVAARLRGGR